MKIHEMSELFAPMFQPKQMEPTVRLWTVCLSDMEFLTGQAAVIQLCRTLKFPPTIAEMRETEAKIRKKIKGEISDAVLSLRNERYCNVRQDRIEQAVARIGGEERLWIPINESESRLNIEEFGAAYRQICLEDMERKARGLYPPDNELKRLK